MVSRPMLAPSSSLAATGPRWGGRKACITAKAPAEQGMPRTGTAELLRHAEDDGQHDDEAGVEDREAEQQGGHTSAKGRGGAEAVDQGISRYLGAPRHLRDPAYHGAEADQQRDRGQGAAETGQHGGDHLVMVTPVARAVSMLTRVNATKACTLNRMISTSNMTMAPPATENEWATSGVFIAPSIKLSSNGSSCCSAHFCAALHIAKRYR